MRRRDWVLSVIGWDGCLPVLVAFSPSILPLVLPNRDLAEVTAVLLIPMITALIRTQHGYRQIRKRFGRVSLGRQFLFGCAIVVLLVFEIGAAGAASSARNTPPSGWLLAAVFYLTYLVLIVRALRPQRLVDA
jgi:hypothetical protein